MVGLFLTVGVAFGQEKPSPFREFYDRLLFPSAETGSFKPDDVVASRREILPIGIDGTLADTLYYVVTYFFELDLPGAQDPASDEMSLLIVEDLRAGIILGQYEWGWSRVDRLNVPWFAVWRKALPRSEGEALVRLRAPSPLTKGVVSPEGGMRVKLIPNGGGSPPSAVRDLDRFSTRAPDSIEHTNEEGLLWQSAAENSWERFSGKLIMLSTNKKTQLLRRYRPGRASDESYNMKMSWRFYWDASARKLICIEGEHYSIPRNLAQIADEQEGSQDVITVLRERILVFPTSKSR